MSDLYAIKRWELANRDSDCVRILLLAGVLSLLVACGGGGGGSDGESDSGGSETGTATPTSFDNKVVLYIRPPATSSSDYLPGYDITLESNTQYLWRYVPDLDRSDLVDSNFNPSYASSNIFPYSVDDRLLVRREWRPFEIGGHHDFAEYSINNFAQTNYFDIRRPYYFTDGCSAVVGDAYYYKSHRNFDIFSGNVGGDFYRYQFSNGSNQLLISYGLRTNCYGELMSDSGVLYDVYATPPGSPSAFSFHRRDLSTGLPDTLPILSLNEDQPANFNAYRYAVSGGTFYMARRRISDGNVEVWRQQFSPVVEPQPLNIIDQSMGALSSLFLDVDDSHLMLATNKGSVLLLNTASGLKQEFSLGVDVTEIVQVYIDN